MAGIASANTPPPEKPPADAVQRKEEAKRQFMIGFELQGKGDCNGAVAAFLRSRELYPTRNATNNAAICLVRLDRPAEALAMFETLLREFPDLPHLDKRAVQEEIGRLRTQIGAIDVQGAPAGAQVQVDGINEGEAPLLQPLRVRSGSHVVRVYAEGFAPFQKRVEVAGGHTVTVTAKLATLVESGQITVVERDGKALEVVLDGVVVGITPWSGRVGTGAHVVALRGEGVVGSEPTEVQVRAERAASVTLHGEPLGGEVNVTTEPAGADIVIDGVRVSHGEWRGRLKAGKHVIGATALGYSSSERTIDLGAGAQEVALELDRDLDHERWKLPAKVVFDAAGALAVSPGFGGVASQGCGEGCSAGPPLGVMATLHAGYEIASGWGFGGFGGFLLARQAIDGRSASATPIGLPARSASADETLEIAGGLFGIWGGIHRGGRPSFSARLGAGGLVARVADRREAVFQLDGSSYAAPDLVSATTAGFVAVAPSLRIGLDVREDIELFASLTGLVLVPVQTPRWEDDGERPVILPDEGYARYPDEATVGSVVFVIAPGLGVRYAL